MRIAVFSTHTYDRAAIEEANQRHYHQLTFLETRLTERTAALAHGFDCVCPFVNDRVNEGVIQAFAKQGVRLLSLRSAGFNHVDLRAASAAGIVVARVPAYSPYAVAEHATALILTLDRHIHRSWARVREGNFALDGLLGFDLHGKAVGVVGTGRIGSVFARIMTGFGCRVLATDPFPSEEVSALGATYVPFDALLAAADVVSLHVPLVPETRHLIDGAALARMKEGAMLVNTSRGGVIDTRAVIQALKTKRLGALGLDVYEEEEGLFFEDLSEEVIQDDVFARLLTFPNVIITGHQGFFTREALANIAETTLANATAFERTGRPLHEVPAPGESSSARSR